MTAEDRASALGRSLPTRSGSGNEIEESALTRLAAPNLAVLRASATQAIAVCSTGSLQDVLTSLHTQRRAVSLLIGAILAKLDGRPDTVSQAVIDKARQVLHLRMAQPGGPSEEFVCRALVRAVRALADHYEYIS